jgi:alpha-tubulin suppressor-like RCC1 family protein
VVGGITFASLTAGGDHTCGLTGGRAAYCWGANGVGELGDGSTTDRATPVAVGGGITFAGLTAGEGHTCGLTSAGAAYCWGWNSYGQLGRGDTLAAATPAAVAGGITFASLAAGGFHTCGLTSGGAAYCWGSNNGGPLGDGIGQLGDGWTRDRHTPVAVSGGITFGSLTAGVFHSCGLTSGGAAYCWGSNFFFVLGDGSATDRHTPVAVAHP